MFEVEEFKGPPQARGGRARSWPSLCARSHRQRALAGWDRPLFPSTPLVFALALVARSAAK
eukprot:scaffold146705_cov32-Tisochrysis_lutea.AAC.3